MTNAGNEENDEQQQQQLQHKAIKNRATTTATTTPNIFRRGFNRASSLIGNITGTLFRKNSVTVIHPITGVSSIYSNINTDYEKDDLNLHMCNDPGEIHNIKTNTTNHEKNNT